MPITPRMLEASMNGSISMLMRRVKAPAETPAVDGADDQVPRQAGLHGDGGGFRVANLAHHDHLRVLPHDAPQRDGISEVLGRVDLRLADHRQVELHRVFHRADADAVPSRCMM